MSDKSDKTDDKMAGFMIKWEFIAWVIILGSAGLYQIAKWLFGF